MLLKSDCPQCKNQLRVAEWTSGQAIGCPSCGVLFFPLPDEIEASKRGVSVGTPREKQSGTGRLRPRAPRTKGVKLTFGISVALASLLLVGGMAVAMVWFSRRVPDPDIMALVPSDAVTVGGMNVEEGSRDERAAKMQEAIASRSSYRGILMRLAPLGFEQKDVMRVVIASGPKTGVTAIVKLVRGRKFDRDRIAAAAFGGETMSVGDRSYVRARKGGMCYYLAAPRVMVVANEDAILDIMGRPPGEIDLNSDLKSLINRCGGSQVWLATLHVGDKRKITFYYGLPVVGEFNLATFTVKKPPTSFGDSYWITVSGEFLELSRGTLYDSRFDSALAVEMTEAATENTKKTSEDTGKIGNYSGDMLKALKIGLDTASFKTVGRICQISMKLEWTLANSEFMTELRRLPPEDDAGSSPPSGVSRPTLLLPPGGVPPL